MVVLSGTVGIKLLAGYMLNIKDDVRSQNDVITIIIVSYTQNHIGALLLAKFTTYQDFHTQLYTCAAEFDFLSLEVCYQFIGIEKSEQDEDKISIST